MTSPAVELFKYMEMEIEQDLALAEQRKAEMHIQYLSNIFSRPLEGKPDPKYLKAKEEFESLLMPREDKKVTKTKKSYEWDFDPETLLERDG